MKRQKRQLLTQLLGWKAQPARKPLLIDGARQTGKTYLLRELLGAAFPNVLLVDFQENPGLADAFAGSLSPQTVVENIALAVGQAFNPGADLLILDEIGECPRAVTSLKYFAENAPDWFVAASGSNIGLLTSFPVGKVEQHILRPMTFQEFLWASGDAKLTEAFEQRSAEAVAHAKLFEKLTEYYFTGGMPEAVSSWFGQEGRAGQDILRQVEAVEAVHRNLAEGYRRDFGKYAGKVDAQLIGAVFDNIPTQLSAVADGSSRRFKFKGVHPRRSRYAEFEDAISWLCRCRLVLRNYPLEGQPRLPLKAHRSDNLLKLFLFDVGLLNSMLGTGYEEIKRQGYEYKGFVAENFVQQELAALGIDPTYSWQGERAQVDFLLKNERGDVVPLEVKSGGSTRARSLQSYIEKHQPSKAFKLTGRKETARGATTELPLYYTKHLPQLW